MAEIKILVQGYAYRRKKGHQASPSSVLVFDGNTKILVDPGANARALLAP